MNRLYWNALCMSVNFGWIYKKFREKRAELRKKNRNISGLTLTKTLDNYAQTGTEYTKVLKQIIQQNQLKDFDEVKLLPLSVKYKNII